MIKRKKFTTLAFLAIFVLGTFFRLVGLNWDQGQMLHPDERFLAMVTHDLAWPQSLKEYFDNKNSPLNPYNKGYDFFVYGTLPVFLTRCLANLFSYNTYQEIILLGRKISVLLDLATIILIALIGKKLFPQKGAFLWTSLFYAISVLPVQLAHFFAVDSSMNFFLWLAFYFLLLFGQKHKTVSLVFTGISLGAAASCKITALLFSPLITLLLYFSSPNKKSLLGWVKNITLVTVCCLLSWRFFQPYIFTNFFLPNPQFLANLNSLKEMSQAGSWYPPSLQWQKTRPIIYPFKNILFWGLGLPLGLLSSSGLILFPKEVIKKEENNQRRLAFLITYFYFLLIFIYLGSQFAKPMRYFLPFYPFFSLAAAFTVSLINKKASPKEKKILNPAIIILALVWPLSFLNIYFTPHSRIKASQWIYQNIPAGSTISCEYWDDCLPLSLNQIGKTSSFYQTKLLSFYDLESAEKWEKINSQLSQIDYLILSSNRVWKSIINNPERYPQTSQFYRDLFSGKLPFTRIAEISSYPCFPPKLSWLCFPDQAADESFTVYDHPQIIIFQKAKQIPSWQQ